MGNVFSLKIGELHEKMEEKNIGQQRFRVNFCPFENFFLKKKFS